MPLAQYHSAARATHMGKITEMHLPSHVHVGRRDVPSNVNVAWDVPVVAATVTWVEASLAVNDSIPKRHTAAVDDSHDTVAHADAAVTTVTVLV